MISCIIPAAGFSSRMGSWKLLLPWRGTTVIEYVIRSLQPVTDSITVVTGFRGEELESRLAQYAELSCVRNDSYQLGMFSSIRMGALALPPVDTCIIMHGDLPLVTTNQISRLVGLFRQFPDGEILQPRVGTTPGHPVIVSPRVLATIAACTPTQSMRDVFRVHAVRYTDESDPAFITDIDTPEAYDALLSNS